ncbi:MAG: 2-oxo acid dehydrogenase subunit E2, partial [bacterium]|nr:2-oxo acid dehydrogenase subunit E2 [bacterium]
KMETDKVVTDIPSPKSGTIAAVFGKEGDLINVGDPLVEVEIEGVAGEEAQQVAKEEPKPAGKEAIAEKGFGVVGTLEVAGDSAYLPVSNEGVLVKEEEVEEPTRKKALATPVARAMAKDMGIDITKVKGTGPGGRVMKADIKSYYENLQKRDIKPGRVVEQEPAVNPVEFQPLTQIRKTIARNMIQSKHNAAHMTVLEEVEVSALVELRSAYKERFLEEGLKFSYMPFILKAVAEALKRRSVLNSELDLENNRMVYKKYYNINIAVDTPEGLVVPVVRAADKKSIRQLTVDIANIAEKSRERKLTMEDFKDGT